MKERLKEWLAIKIAYKLLPNRIVYWCAIRVAANATQGKWSGQVVPDLTAMDALKRWEPSHG